MKNLRTEKMVVAVKALESVCGYEGQMSRMVFSEMLFKLLITMSKELQIPAYELVEEIDKINPALAGELMLVVESELDDEEEL